MAEKNTASSSAPAAQAQQLAPAAAPINQNASAAPAAQAPRQPVGSRDEGRDFQSRDNRGYQPRPYNNDRDNNDRSASGPQVRQVTIKTGHVLGPNQDRSQFAFVDGDGSVVTMPMGGVTSATPPTSATSIPVVQPTAAPAAQSAPAPAAAPSTTSVPPINVHVNFTNESDREPVAVNSTEPTDVFWGEVYQPGVGGAYALTNFRTVSLESAKVMSPGLSTAQVMAHQTNCLKPVTTPEEEQAKGAAPYKKGILSVLVGLLMAGLVTFLVLWLCGAGCGGHNDVPPAPPTQTIMVQPAVTSVATCKITEKGETPEGRGYHVEVCPDGSTAVRWDGIQGPQGPQGERGRPGPKQEQAPVAQASAVSAPVVGPYVLNVRTEPASVAQASVVPAVAPVAAAESVASVQVVQASAAE